MLVRLIVVSLVALALMVGSPASGTVKAARATQGQNRYLIVNNKVGGYSLSKGGYRRALRYFGEPVSEGIDNVTCDVAWENALTISFDAGDPGECSDLVENARIETRACPAWGGCPPNGTRWHTRRGLRLGITVKKMRRLYPRAFHQCRSCAGKQHRDLWELDWRFNPELVAEVKAGHVKAITFVRTGH